MTTGWDDVLLIMGDINIDLLPHYHATRTVQYKNMLKSPSACSAVYSCEPSSLPKVDNPREYDDYRPIALSHLPVLSFLLTLYFDTRPPPQSKLGTNSSGVYLLQPICKNESSDLHSIGGYSLDSLIVLA